MTGTTHQMIALVSAGWMLTLHPTVAGPLIGTLAVVSVMVGALTPDFDHPAANIGRRLLGGRQLGRIFRAGLGGHRHITHSLLGIILIGWAARWAAIQLVNPAYTEEALLLWHAYMIGYISHPVADTFTDRGVPWFLPLPWQMKLPPGPEEVRVTTNSFVEHLFVRGGALVVAVLLAQAYWSVFVAFFTHVPTL